MPNPILRLGSSGPAVVQLQKALNAGPTILPKLTADGSFGPKTDSRVKEFQSKNSLLPDGIVGPITWEALKALLDLIAGGTGPSGQPGNQSAPVGTEPAPTENGSAPANELAARQRIADTALKQYKSFSWNGQVSPMNPRIAGKLCCNGATRQRQGGTQIAAIFSLAGAANSQKCLTISKAAEQMYGRQYTAAERNNLDIVSWCGIFSAYVYKVAGLKISGWPLQYNPFGSPGPAHTLRVVRSPEKPQRGDIGIVDPMGGLNHHFVIVDVTGDKITSIDGNAGNYMEIVQKTYTMAEIKSRQGYFLTPIWEKVLL
jgi:peptidoglycan hydrolase-like protein with peptidoglycan-binding domain